MGRAFETALSIPAQTAAIQELEASWGKIYTRLAIFPVAGQEVLRVTATTRCENDAGKPLSAESSLIGLKSLCDTPAKAQEVTSWIFKTADALVSLEEKRHLGPVVDILQARVLAVAIMLAEQLSDGEKATCLDQWERVTFRVFSFYRNDARTKVGDYVRLARKILRQEVGAKAPAEILAELKNLGSDFPVDLAVQNALDKKNCYEGFEAECRYLLWRFEEYLAAKAGAEVNKELRATIWNDRTAAETIEHIYPQNPATPGPWDGKLNAGEKMEAHIHRIGNLLLLPQVLNAEASRKPFSEKKAAYAKSEGLRIVKEVTQKNDWRQQEIEEREAEIIAWAKTAWADVP
jgi:hypothetical protein